MKTFDENFKRIMESIFISSSLNYEDNITNFKKIDYEKTNKRKKRDRDTMLRKR